MPKCRRCESRRLAGGQPHCERRPPRGQQIAARGRQPVDGARASPAPPRALLGLGLRLRLRAVFLPRLRLTRGPLLLGLCLARLERFGELLRACQGFRFHHDVNRRDTTRPRRAEVAAGGRRGLNAEPNVRPVQSSRLWHPPSDSGGQAVFEAAPGILRRCERRRRRAGCLCPARRAAGSVGKKMSEPDA